MKDIINQADQYVLPTYSRFPIVFDHGEGVNLWDAEGKKYLDFASGIGVCALGYHHPEYTKALHEQVDTLLHTSNLFYTKALADASQKLIEASGMNKVFFTNSGAEAIEGAIKLARKYMYGKGQNERYEVIAMNHSFHGRTMGAVSVTGTEHYRTPFEPLIGGVKFAELNNLESVEKMIDEHTCAILLEVVQGEGGIHVSTPEFLQGIKKLADEKDIVLIFDEVQCGMGRTGKMFAYQNYDVLPDIITCAKGLGCGIPVGAFVAGKKVENAMVAGDHGSTYGGNPFVTNAVSKVFDVFAKENVVENAKAVGDYFEEKLKELTDKKASIVEQRGMGLMRGLELSVPVGDVVKAALSKGLVVLSAYGNVLRMLPPLVITKSDVDHCVKVLDEIL